MCEKEVVGRGEECVCVCVCVREKERWVGEEFVCVKEVGEVV